MSRVDEPGPNRRKQADWWIATAVFALALGARLLFLLTWPDRRWPHSLWYEGDAPLWDQWARTLSAGGVFEHGLAIHAPGAAYLLHWLGFAGADDYTGAKVLWCAVSAAACALTYLVVVGEFGRRVGMVAAGLVVFAFASYVQAVSLNVEALYTPLVVAAVALTHRLARRPAWWAAVLLGVVHGVATLLRAEHPLLAVLLAIPVAARWWPDRGTAPRWYAQRVALAAAIALIGFGICLPWMAAGRAAAHRMNTAEAPAPDYSVAEWTADGRAYIESLPPFARADNVAYLSHLAAQEGGGPLTAARARALLVREFGVEPEPLPERLEVSSQGPLVFALANGPASTGGFTKAGLDARFAPDPVLNLALPTHNYLYVHGYEVAMGRVRADPAWWPGLVARKLAIFADGAAQGLTAANLPLGRQGLRRAVDQFTAAPSWRRATWRCLLAVLLLTGVVIAARTRRGGAWMLVIAAKLLVCALFIGYARQAASILPVFAVLTALGIDGLMRVAEHGAGPHRQPLVARAWITTAALLAATALATEIATFLTTRSAPPNATGPVRIEERWGGSAYLCPADMGLQAATSSSPSPSPSPSR